jgi:hypothetical protein
MQRGQGQRARRVPALEGDHDRGAHLKNPHDVSGILHICTHTYISICRSYVAAT